MNAQNIFLINYLKSQIMFESNVALDFGDFSNFFLKN